MSTEGTSLHESPWKLWRRNGLIWAALMVLLFSSLGLAFVPMGVFTPISGVVVAVIKAALVMLLFMEIVSAKPLIRLAVGCGLALLAALFALTLADVLSRLAGG